MRKLWMVGAAVGGASLLWRLLNPQMPISLHDRTVVITGASSGIGEALAHAFAAWGSRLVLVARRADVLETLAAKLIDQYNIRAVVIPADVTRDEDCERIVSTAVETFNRIDIVVNNAGLTMGGAFVNYDPAAIRRLIEVNLYAPIRLTQAALPHMLRQEWGHIVNVSSIASAITPPGDSVYSATKAGLNTFSQIIYREMRHKGIRVTLALPGWTKTPMIKNMDVEKMRATGLLSPFITIDSPTTVAEGIVDAVRFNRRIVFFGGPEFEIGARLAPALPAALDFWYRYIYDPDEVVEAITDQGL